MNRRDRYEHSFRAKEDREFRAIKSPFDQKIIANVEVQDEATATSLLKRASELFANRNYLPNASVRREILNQAAERVGANSAFFSKLIAEEGGKPLKDALIEVSRAAQTLRLCAHEAGFMHGEQIPMQATAATAGRLAVTVREPIGVVLAISAFNHPLNLIAHQLGSAVAAGCPALVKPSQETPLSCIHLIEVLRECGLPEDFAQWVYCSNEVSQKLAESSLISYLTFIGSAKVGWHLHSRVAPGTRLSLEHGGAAPVIIDESFDIDSAIPVLIRGGYYHSGQVCVSVQRIFVAESRMQEFLNRFRAAVEVLKTGDPLDGTTDCGPIIRTRDVERIMKLIDEAVAGGARSLIGGKKLSQSLVAPTILVDVPMDSRIMNEEVFGPVVCINRIKSLEEGVRLANSVPFAFQAAVFTKNLDHAFEAARNLKATAVMVNDSTTLRADWMPFAGGGISGLGIGGVPYSVRDMTREKLLVINGAI